MINHWKTKVKIEFLKKQDEEINAMIEKYQNRIAPNSSKSKLRKDIRKCIVDNEISPEEYFWFNFSSLNKQERKQYLGTKERHRIMVKTGTDSGKAIFRDKYKSYLKFKSYYQRDMINIENDDRESRILLDQFLEKHSRFILKPARSFQGRGIQILENDKGTKEIRKVILEQAPCVLEELIHQGEEMASFHPKSVNTIRMVTCVTKEGVEILFAILRMGANGSVIDNVGAGGIVAAVDLATGTVNSEGYQSDDTTCRVHPDTGKIIPGSMIPRWEELIILAKELAQIVSEQKFVGWDFAYDGEKWCVVEANHSASCQSIQRIQGGIRTRFFEIVSKI